MGSNRASLALAAFLACAGWCSSCAVDRVLLITSEPPGAEVRLDDEVVGTTPLRHPFDHYGKRRVTLYLAGFLSQTRVFDLDAPWYSRFPLDLFSEVLLPFGWKYERKVHVVLQSGESEIDAPDLLSVLERAESLRRAGPEGPRPVPQGYVLPETTPPPGADPKPE